MTKNKVSPRDHILELLKKEVSLSVSDLIGHLHITHMAVRKHLAILEKDDLIKSIEIKQPMGRPLQKYSLTEKGENLFPRNYESITLDFLKDIKEIHGEESVELLFKKREDRLTQEYRNRIQHSSSITEKINKIAQIQNEKGYMASVNQLDEKSFELIEYNCPIDSVAQEFKMACRCETNMFKNVLETDNVRRICCKTEGDDHCKFIFDLA
ncbi:helix-turn-helix transcriptional regulator [Bacillus sp. PS06]|uniref:helix-turn-helix transcriptional regulator n=1 Tax=Bacillus sp. PS06 TaxID=2764176 RepID=UPI00178537CE|nr:metalloregulator ArsR/SmtB family transcription factor [Bacillus sp. PS06]MBD8070745.1 transcriptional regulator [Bacillus sp. PS06]